MLEEPTLPVTPTHSGVEAKGTILGLEGKTIVPVLLATVGSTLLLALLVVGAPEGAVLGRVVVAWMPTLATLAYVGFFVHRRPPHFARDWWLGWGLWIFERWGSERTRAFAPVPPCRARPWWAHHLN